MHRRKKILLVDDSEQDVELIISCLRENRPPLAIEVAHDGEEALDYLYCRGKFADRTGPDPAVILLDLKMPKVDGFEVLAAMRREKKLKTIPVVILTSSRENKDIIRSYSLGANAYVVKPVDSLEFIATMKHLCLFWLGVNLVPQ